MSIISEINGPFTKKKKGNLTPYYSSTVLWRLIQVDIIIGLAGKKYLSTDLQHDKL